MKTAKKILRFSGKTMKMPFMERHMYLCVIQIQKHVKCLRETEKRIEKQGHFRYHKSRM